MNNIQKRIIKTTSILLISIIILFIAFFIFNTSQTKLSPVKEDGKWGFVDENRNFIIKPRYENAGPFREGLAAVKLDSKWGYINRSGEMVIENKFDNTTGFSEGMAAVKQNDKWGYIDKTGELVIETIYDNADDFSEGVADVEIGEEGKQIDKLGEESQRDKFRIPLGRWIENSLDFLTFHLSPVTRAFSNFVEGGFGKIAQVLTNPKPLDILVVFGFFILIQALLIYIKGINRKAIIRIGVFTGIGLGMMVLCAFTTPPIWLMVLLFTIVAWRIANLKIALFTLIGLSLIWNMGLWLPTIDTLSLVSISTIIAVIIGIPLGILAGLSPKFHRVITPILDFMQTMPAFVYLIPAIPFFGIGPVSAVFATVIFSVPPSIRLTSLGIRQVPKELIEASDAFGSTKMQKLFKIQLPIATQTIMAGINQTIMLALSMVVIAAMIGAKGLGGEVWTAIQRLQPGMGFEAGIGVVIIAMILDRITQKLADKGQRKRNIIAKMFDYLISKIRRSNKNDNVKVTEKP